MSQEQIAARLAARMAEPLEETQRKSLALQARTSGTVRGPRTLMMKLAYEYASARLWHIKHGIPLPPFSNGNYREEETDYPTPELGLIMEGNRQLITAWKQGTAPPKRGR